MSVSADPTLRLLENALRSLSYLPRLGWAEAPTPVDELGALGRELGLPWLGVKRDDLTQPLHGGTKTRKLDFLLAAPPWREAPRWVSVGAIGSGHLVACTAAAEALGRELDAHLFAESLSDGVLDNLAYVASGPVRLHYWGSRLALAAGKPAVLLRREAGGLPVIAPGGSSAEGMLGLVRAGLELALQVRQGLLPEPARLYLPLGSGGTVVGLALGLGVGGMRTVIHAVSAVERIFATRSRLDSLHRELAAHLKAMALPDMAAAKPVRIVSDFKHVGPGYGEVSAGSLAAVRELAAHGVALEPVYSGKAMAGLLRDVRRGGVGPVLFWSTVRRLGALPHDPDWRQRLPPKLQRFLQVAEADEAAVRAGHRPPGAQKVTRRRFVLGGLALAGAAVIAVRSTGYEVAGWQGRVLSATEAAIVIACAEALLPPAPPLPSLVAGQLPDYSAVARGVDAYLAQLPAHLRNLSHLLLHALEQAPTLLGVAPSRLTRLPPTQRAEFLADLGKRGGTWTEAWDAVRELVMAGYYQHPASWPALGYGGPWVAAGPRARRQGYAKFVAAPGALPRSLVR